MFPDKQFISRFSTAATIREEAQREVTLGKLAQLPGPLQCIDAVHFEAQFHAAKVGLMRVRAKDRSPLPRHISSFGARCTEKVKLSGAWCFIPFDFPVFHSVARIAVETQHIRFCSRVKDVRYCPAQQNYCLLHAHLFAPNYPLSNTKKR